MDVAESPRQVFSNSLVSKQRQVKPCGLAMGVSTCTNPESTSDFTFLLSHPLTALCCLLCVHVTLPSILGASFLLLTFFPEGGKCLMSPSMCCLDGVFSILCCHCLLPLWATPCRIHQGFGPSRGHILNDLCCGRY